MVSKWGTRVTLPPLWWSLNRYKNDDWHSYGLSEKKPQDTVSRSAECTESYISDECLFIGDDSAVHCPSSHSPDVEMEGGPRQLCHPVPHGPWRCSGLQSACISIHFPWRSSPFIQWLDMRNYLNWSQNPIADILQPTVSIWQGRMRQSVV